MKIVSSFLVLLLISFKISAQESDPISLTAQISMQATIVQSIELITINSMSFQNSSPDDREIYVNPVSDINAGYMIAVGAPGVEFRLNYLPERTLTNVEAEGTLIFTYEISGNDVEEQSTSELFVDENQVITFNEDGRYYIWVGGRVDLSNATPGSYEGDFTIEIDYI